MHASRHVAYGLSLVGVTVGFWLWMNGNSLGRPLMILCWLCSPSVVREESADGWKTGVVLLMAVIGMGLVLGWGFLVMGLELSPEVNRMGQVALYGLFALWVVGQYVREWRTARRLDQHAPSRGDREEEAPDLKASAHPGDDLPSRID